MNPAKGMKFLNDRPLEVLDKNTPFKLHKVGLTKLNFYQLEGVTAGSL